MAGDFWGASKPPAGVLVDPSHPLASGLVLCLPFNEGMGLQVASAIDGTPPGRFQGMASWVAGERGAALRAAAAGAYVEYSPPPPVLTRLRQITVAAWIKPLVTTRADHVTQWGASGTRHFNLLSGLAAASKWQFFYSRNGTESQSTGTGTLSAFTLGRWYFVVGTYDGAIGRLSVDGGREEAVSGTFTGELYSGSTANVRLGGAVDVAGVSNAEIAFVGIWNRALAAQEIRNLYAQSFAMFRGPVWWRYPGVASASLRLLASLGVGT